MPFIHSQTSVSVSAQKEAELYKKLGEIIPILPGKSEQWLMLRLSDGCRMAFRGKSDKPIAMVEVKLFAKANDDAYERFTGALSKVFSDVLGIAPDQLYVKYEECDHWGYNGHNF